jgi:mannose-1-phosphate guanylyltransferase/mannose-6-phosphate isomerase
MNKTNNTLEIIEVQLGDYLEEDDIIRFNDDFDRK